LRISGGPSSDAVIRAAALRGVLAVEKAKAAPEILNALRDANPKIGSAAAKAVGDLGDAATWATVLAELPKLPSQSQAVLLRLVCDPSARPVVLKAVQSDQDDVRLAALEALGRIGDQDAVPLLLNIAVAEKGPSQAAAREALHALPGKGANAALVSAVTGQQPAARVEAIRVLAARGAAEATPLLLNTARDADKAVRLESLAALATLAKTDSLPALVRLLVEAKAEDRSAAEQAVLAVARRSEDAEAAAGCVLAAMGGQGVEIRTILLRVAARIPSRKALDALRAARRDAEPAMVDAAIRGLAEWPDGAPLGDLLEIARASENKTHKVLALRGFIRLASLPKARPAAESVKLLAQALPLATRAEEKRMVLAAVAQLRHPAGLDLATT
ncbi:MAG: HEAT repeat domain-containing protein, partial [Thermoguttaceae bacterium]|nr:HEAT repeat domain-containing protein [Thermoguttaceae bacterium]